MASQGTVRKCTSMKSSGFMGNNHKILHDSKIELYLNAKLFSDEDFWQKMKCCIKCPCSLNGDFFKLSPS